jgi:integrase
MAKNDLAFVTVSDYRRILDSVWRPAIGAELFEKVRYSTLVRIADAWKWKKKTYNNAISVLRCAFDYGYRDHPEKHNPATGLKCFRITKKDRPVVDPFSIQEAEALIAALHRDWGEAQGNYDEFRFFTGLRPSEQIALLVSDCDLVQAKISVSKARVDGRDKDRTKTSEDRLVELCPRALEVLKRQLALRARLKLAGAITHEELFFKDTGEPIRNLQYPWVRWRSTLQRMKVRYRDPYNARHSSVSWNLMIGGNPLRVAKNHGHGVQTMLEVYAAWIEGAQQSDVEAIKEAMVGSPRARARAAVFASVNVSNSSQPEPPQSPEFGTNLALERGACRLSRGKCKERHGGERGIRTGFRHSGKSASYRF